MCGKVDFFTPTTTGAFGTFKQNEVGRRCRKVSVNVPTFNDGNVLFSFLGRGEIAFTISSNQTTIEGCDGFELNRFAGELGDETRVIFIQQNIPNMAGDFSEP